MNWWRYFLDWWASKSLDPSDPYRCPACGSSNSIATQADLHRKDGAWRGSGRLVCQEPLCGKEYRWKRR